MPISFCHSDTGMALPSMSALRTLCDGAVVRINIPIKAKNPAAPRFESAWIIVEDGGAKMNLTSGVIKDAKTKLTGTITSELTLKAFHHLSKGDRITLERNKIVEIAAPAEAAQ
jgi:hypothetical protein